MSLEQPYGQPAPGMRAAHADRERAVDVLKAAYAEGRLSAAEYEQRFVAAHQALTYGELAVLVADLPAGPVAAPFGVPVPPAFLPARRANGMAIASLVLGLACLPTMGATGLPAVVTGHLARAQLRSGLEEGDGMATAGLVLGYLSLAGWALVLLVAALFVV